MFKKMILFAVFTGLTIVATRMGVEAIAAAKVWTPYTATTAHTKYGASTGKVLEVDVGKRAARRDGSHIMERALPSFIGPMAMSVLPCVDPALSSMSRPGKGSRSMRTPHPRPPIP